VVGKLPTSSVASTSCKEDQRWYLKWLGPPQQTGWVGVSYSLLPLLDLFRLYLV